MIKDVGLNRLAVVLRPDLHGSNFDKLLRMAAVYPPSLA
jgi:hypothetical protein